MHHIHPSPPPTTGGTRHARVQFPQQGASFVSRVAEMNFATILPAHGEAPIGDAKRAWAECFDFMGVPEGGEGAPGAAGQ